MRIRYTRTKDKSRRQRVEVKKEKAQNHKSKHSHLSGGSIGCARGRGSVLYNALPGHAPLYARLTQSVRRRVRLQKMHTTSERGRIITEIFSSPWTRVREYDLFVWRAQARKQTACVGLKVFFFLYFEGESASLEEGGGWWSAGFVGVRETEFSRFHN